MEINKKILKKADKILAERKIEEEKESEMWVYISHCIKADICPNCGEKVIRICPNELIFKCKFCLGVTKLPNNRIVI